MAGKKKKPVRGNKKRHALSPAKRVKRVLGHNVKIADYSSRHSGNLIYGGYRLYGELLLHPRLDIKSINVSSVEKVGNEGD